MEDIPKNLKNARPRTMTQKEAAKKIGISINSLSNYENGHTDIPVSIAQKLCELYGVSESILFSEK